MELDAPQIPQGTPDYVILPGAAVDDAPLGTFVIATDGQNGWTVSWRNDAVTAHYTGDIYGASDEHPQVVNYYLENAQPTDSLLSIANNHIRFDSVTAGGDQRVLRFTTGAPLVLDLYVNGAPAVGRTFFPRADADGSLMTEAAEIMPFRLIVFGSVF